MKIFSVLNSQMRTIKPMPEAARNTVRSGIILVDLTRVVEELVFNSLDAGATKVSIFVGVVTCYVKVVDNGSGISRDGLVLLGERYATSKLCHLADMDAASGNFGFRGEALASISDLSLLEIVTKAYGRPNGYRKVMKGSKCLFLGISDDRKDAGTTVVARDLFYNQPVRRKYMQSSPKKVLHSVKKCVFRIALVQSKVSFSIIDIESDDEILSTQPSSSPLSLLMNGFGIEDPNSLHEVNASDGVLKLSGYISSASNSFAGKVFQYVYINSRFVSKGPIHKLLSHLAARFECLDQWNSNNGSRKGKRSRLQPNPAYILNLSCPQSVYDLTFEPSKAYVEFKDWKLILTFIEKAIQHLWGETLDSFDHAVGISREDINDNSDNIILIEEEMSEISKSARKKCRTQNQETLSHLLYFPLDELIKDGNYLLKREHDKIPFPELSKNASLFKKKETEWGFPHQTAYSFQSWDMETLKDENCHWIPDNNFLSAGCYFLENDLTAAGRSDNHVDCNILRSHLTNESFNTEHSLRNGSAGDALCFPSHEFDNKSEVMHYIRKPFLHSCCSRGSLPLDGAILACEKGFESPNDVLTKYKEISIERYNIPQVDDKKRSFDYFARTSWQAEASSAHHHLRFTAEDDMAGDSNFLQRASSKTFPSYSEPSAEEKFVAMAQGEVSGCAAQSSGSEWCSRTRDPLFETVSRDVEHFTSNNALERRPRWCNMAHSVHLANDEDTDCKFSNDIMSKSASLENWISSSADVCFDLENHAVSNKDSKFLNGDNLCDKLSLRHSVTLIDETDGLCNSSAKHYTATAKYGNTRDEFRYQHSVPEERSKRSHSAPPFYKQKRRFISLNCISKTGSAQSDAHDSDADFTPQDDSKHLQKSSGVRNVHSKPNFVEDVPYRSWLAATPDVQNKLDTASEIKKNDKHGRSLCSSPHRAAAFEDFIPEEIQDSLNSGSKWRTSCPQTTKIHKSQNIHHQDDILDVSSGFLQHVAGNSLIPLSINRNCLENAKVLQQLDKKFIPVVAGGILAVVDQHAADERIRLEELRQKVLSGEGKTVTYLDAEQELILPEIGYQLLQNYAEEINDWGWICNVHVQGSKSFKKNLSILHQQPTVVTLLANSKFDNGSDWNTEHVMHCISTLLYEDPLASLLKRSFPHIVKVPCILGVNLSDADLLEFLQQLADTDGSSTMPPSVIRVLNLKACRGAIMFGDSLLPSECSLIVEELRQTSLCFQCAHGRPTTVPLVNMEALHKQMEKLGSSETWHGLLRHELDLDRATMRLSAARGYC